MYSNIVTVDIKVHNNLTLTDNYCDYYPSFHLVKNT